MTKYTIQTTVSGSFESIVAKVKDALKYEGFGILTEINVKETLEKKLNIEYPNYIILGACNPQSAYKVLQEEKEIGLLLPCNVIVYEEKGIITVSAIRPTVAMEMIEKQNVAIIAQEVESKLERVISSLE
jgi:uncharacterized protein (DUF302 family)